MTAARMMLEAMERAWQRELLLDWYVGPPGPVERHDCGTGIRGLERWTAEDEWTFEGYEVAYCPFCGAKLGAP